MSNNNARFLSAYNRLDNYLQSIVRVRGHVNMISYLERILPEKQRSELKTIREYKNTIESHGVNPGYKKPEVPEEWIRWLLNELEWCKRNRDVIAPKLQKSLDAKSKFPKNNNPKQNGNFYKSNQNSFSAEHSSSSKPQTAVSFLEYIYKNTPMDEPTFKLLKMKANTKTAKLCLLSVLKKLFQVYNATDMSYSDFQALLHRCTDSTKINDSTVKSIDAIKKLYLKNEISYFSFTNELGKLLSYRY